ncbi:MAG: cytochrome c oxidase subunit II [Verrucomicrobium sp.]|nr:cytochrome c oxidase subunit II [Verrucomicrobium sp.]
MLPDITLSTFSNASPQAKEITTLFINVLLVCSVIFVIVTVWVGYSIWKFRHKEGEDGEPDQHQINKNYEITWTIIPALICVLLGYWTVKSMFGPNGGEPRHKVEPDIVITGAQWWWDVRYPKLGVVTANEIHVPTGRPLVVDLESNDVIHTFWVPELGRKEQMIPGHHSLLSVESTFIGQYLGACAQYCGNQHAWMRLLLVSESPADFDAWVAKQKSRGPLPPPLVSRAEAGPAPVIAPNSGEQTPQHPAGSGAERPLGQPIPLAAKLGGGTKGATPVINTLMPSDKVAKLSDAASPAPTSDAIAAKGDVARGLQVYKEQTCGTCHAVEGVSDAPYAPNLSHLASRQTLGAGVLKNTHEDLYKWMANPQAFKPGCNMPNFHLTPEQTSDLVAYLETLK